MVWGILVVEFCAFGELLLAEREMEVAVLGGLGAMGLPVAHARGSLPVAYFAVRAVRWDRSGTWGTPSITDNAGRGLEAVTRRASIIAGVVARLEGGGQCKKWIICDLVREEGEKKK